MAENAWRLWRLLLLANLLNFFDRVLPVIVSEPIRHGGMEAIPTRLDRNRLSPSSTRLPECPLADGPISALASDHRARAPFSGVF